VKAVKSRGGFNETKLGERVNVPESANGSGEDPNRQNPLSYLISIGSVRPE